MTLEDKFDPPTFASNGADRWINRNVEINGADAWESLANIEVNVFFEGSPGFIVCSESSHLATCSKQLNAFDLRHFPGRAKINHYASALFRNRRGWGRKLESALRLWTTVSLSTSE